VGQVILHQLLSNKFHLCRAVERLQKIGFWFLSKTAKHNTKGRLLLCLARQRSRNWWDFLVQNWWLLVWFLNWFESDLQLIFDFYRFCLVKNSSIQFDSVWLWFCSNFLTTRTVLKFHLNSVPNQTKLIWLDSLLRGSLAFYDISVHKKKSHSFDAFVSDRRGVE
jgi:hypothetical protein